MKNKKKIIISIFVAVIFELFININAFAYQIGNYKQIQINNTDLKLNDLTLRNNKFIVTGNKPSIEIINLNKKIKNISYNFSKNTNVDIIYIDEMFSNYNQDNIKKSIYREL